MSENRSKYIERLIIEIKSLEESVHVIKNSDSMPFSFFRESFEKTQEISHLLHKLEFMQVDNMKNQMEKLVFFLSESEKNAKTQERELEKARETERGLINDLEKEKQKEIGLLKDNESQEQSEIDQFEKPEEIYTQEVVELIRKATSIDRDERQESIKVLYGEIMACLGNVNKQINKI